MTTSLRWKSEVFSECSILRLWALHTPWNMVRARAPSATSYPLVPLLFWHGNFKLLLEMDHPVLTSDRIGEKFLEWVDDPLPPDTILESVTLYWLTETFARAIYAYRLVRLASRDIFLTNKLLLELPPAAHPGEQ